MCSRLLAVLAIALLRDVASHGMTTFQCPNGYYLSKFGSAFDGTERFYNFACSRFSSDMLVFDEECTTTETASTQNGDLYLSCGSDQYTVGVEMIENVAPGVNSWQLLCCHSESIKIRTGDCIDTKFINDYRRSSTFSSSAQIIRRWQAMAENGDRRWWLQLCPVDVNIKKPEKESDIRARRQVPWQWSRGRFPPVVEEYNPLFMEQEKREEIRRHRLFEENNRVLQKDVAARRKFMTTPETSTTTTTTTTSTEELTQSTTAAARMPTSTRRTKTTTEKHTNALDYYDMYDDNFDKTKHNGPNGFLNGISDFLQNIQDGLSMAQIAFPQPGTKKTKQGTTTDAPAFKIDSSSDDDSLTIDMTAPNMKGRAFIQAGPMPDVPVEAKRRKPLPVPNIEGGTIENMLQMLGLCKGH
uniref:CVNH domain-containing protein n=1 Tax=Steinernema glaseri TaxID=37863 RepID=A0A1I8AP67_9BILA